MTEKPSYVRRPLREVAVPGTSLESITGRLGVGSVALLGLFMFFDGHTRGVYALVDTYGKSVAWGSWA